MAYHFTEPSSSSANAPSVTSHAGDTSSARAWLSAAADALTDPAVDGELRLALVTICARQNRVQDILAILQPP